MSLQSLYWSEPLWLLLVLQPVLLLFFRWLHNRQQLNRYAEAKNQPWVEVHNHVHWSHFLLNRNTVYFIAWLCFAVAAAGPRFIEEIPDNNSSHGVDIMVVVDISRSMHVQDISPNRLVRAKLELQSLLPLLQHDRLGLVVYAAHAHQYMPLTYDKSVMRHYLGNLDSLSPPTQGSRPVEGLRLAEQLLQKQSTGSDRNKAILLITDGDNLQEPIDIDTHIFVLGAGSIEGDAIPGYNGKWLRDKSRVLVSRLHEDDLISIAEQNHGFYSRIYKNNTDWDVLYNHGIKNISNISSVGDDEKVIWRELYIYALLPGLLLLILSTSSFNIYRIQKPISKPDSKSFEIITIIVFCVLLIPTHKYAQAGDNNSAYKSFIDKNYISALEKYRSIDGYQGRFGEAASAYRLNDSSHAISVYKQAFLFARNDRQRASALYNLGNSHFQNGDYASAVSSYQDSLIYDPDTVAAQQNMLFSQKLHKTVQKRLARLEKLLRPGRGPKQAPTNDKTVINDDTSVSVDESNDVLDPESDSGINITASLPEELVLKGLEHAQLASAKKSTNTTSSDKKERYNLPVSSQQLDIIKDDQPAFWNRILEVEEGFPAPLDKPRQIKGLRSW